MVNALLTNNNRQWQLAYEIRIGKHDEQLKNDLEKYVLRNFSRKKVLDFVARDYPQYAWSLGTLKGGVNLKNRVLLIVLYLYMFNLKLPQPIHWQKAYNLENLTKYISC